MSKYATTQKFANQRASVGRIVVLAAPSHDDRTKICLRAGIIVAISSRTDRPYIKDLGDSGTTSQEWVHYDAQDADGCHSVEEAMESMPMGCWSWPLSV